MDETFDFRARPHDSGEEALPLPTGSLIYESLTTRFVSFDRLLETLSESGHSGYIKLVAPGSNGLVLLKQGKLLESLYRAPEELRRGESAIRAIEGAVHRGDGVLDIVSLDADVVQGLHGVASGRPTYPDLYASWVNSEGLVGFLKSRAFTGSIIITNSAASGVVIFDHGQVTAAFTSTSGELANTEHEVLALCQDPEARIEVREAELPRVTAASNGAEVARAISALIEEAPAS